MISASLPRRLPTRAASLIAAREKLVMWSASFSTCSFSVVSQCLFYHHCQPVVCRLFPEQKFSPEQVEKLADHITGFSLAAIKEAAAQKRPAAKRRRT